MIALAGFIGIAGVEGALILARAAVEERAECDRDNPAEVENAGARIFEGGSDRIALYASFRHNDEQSVRENLRNRAIPPFRQMLVTPTGIEPVLQP